MTEAVRQFHDVPIEIGEFEVLQRQRVEQQAFGTLEAVLEVDRDFERAQLDRRRPNERERKVAAYAIDAGNQQPCCRSRASPAIASVRLAP